jgi:DNA-binding Lrp family transcriptional regulator
MPRHKLDAIDKRMLHDLQADGRLSNVDLAKRLAACVP